MAADWEARVRERIDIVLAPVSACDAVNAPMIRHWCEAMGHPFEWEAIDEAPATMLQAWLFPGPTRQRPPGSALEDATSVQSLLAEAGYTAAVTVQTEMEFLRPLQPGDRLDYTSTLRSMGEEKRTALGAGRFLAFEIVVRDADRQEVGTIRFTNLAYRPGG